MSKKEHEYDSKDVESIEEDIEIETLEANNEAKLKKMRQQLKSCDDEKRKNIEDLQRLKADFLNSKKRLEAEKSKGVERAIKSFIEKLLPLCDSFSMAKSNKEVWESVSQEWRVGVEGISSQLENILTAYKVKVVNPTGERFDPARHEAISTQPVKSKKQDQLITEVVQFGYERNVDDQTEVIRPARVIVGEFNG